MDPTSTLVLACFVGLFAIHSFGLNNVTYAVISMIFTYATNVAYRADYQSFMRLATDRFKPRVIATFDISRYDTRINFAITLLGQMMTHFALTVFLHAFGIYANFWLQQLITMAHLFTTVFDISPGKYAFFICHHQGSGGKQAEILAQKLQGRGHTVWLDNKVDRTERTLDGMRRGVRSSRNVIILLTGRYERDGRACDSTTPGAVYESPFSRWFCHEELKTAREAGVRILGVQEMDERHNKPNFAKIKEVVRSRPSSDPIHEAAEENLKLLDDTCFINLRVERHEVPSMMHEIETHADGNIFQEGNALLSTCFDSIDTLRERYRNVNVLGIPLLRPTGTAFFSAGSRINWEQHGALMIFILPFVCFSLCFGLFHESPQSVICREVRETVCPRKSVIVRKH